MTKLNFVSQANHYSGIDEEIILPGWLPPHQGKPRGATSWWSEQLRLLTSTSLTGLFIPLLSLTRAESKLGHPSVCIRRQRIDQSHYQLPRVDHNYFPIQVEEFGDNLLDPILHVEEFIKRAEAWRNTNDASVL